MGIVSMASNLRESIFVTNSLDGNICLRSSQTGALVYVTLTSRRASSESLFGAYGELEGFSQLSLVSAIPHI